eukprot:Platyproteum_vivax@DN16274_c0_g1_i1.p2
MCTAVCFSGQSFVLRLRDGTSVWVRSGAQTLKQREDVSPSTTLLREDDAATMSYQASASASLPGGTEMRLLTKAGVNVQQPVVKSEKNNSDRKKKKKKKKKSTLRYQRRV